MTIRASIEPGSDLIGRFGDTVVLISRAGATEVSATELLDLVEEIAADREAPAPAVAAKLAGWVLGHLNGSVAAFGIVVPVPEGVVVFLRGPVRCTVSAGGTVRELSGEQALTWVDQILPGAFDWLAIGSANGADLQVDPMSDLREGIVPGQGFVLSGLGAPGHAAAAAAASASFGAAPAGARTPGGGTPAAGPPSRGERAGRRGAVRPGARPGRVPRARRARRTRRAGPEPGWVSLPEEDEPSEPAESYEAPGRYGQPEPDHYGQPESYERSDAYEPDEPFVAPEAASDPVAPPEPEPVAAPGGFAPGPAPPWSPAASRASDFGADSLAAVRGQRRVGAGDAALAGRPGHRPRPAVRHRP